MAQRLLNKVAVITGAGSGIGKAMAERFLSEGAKVAIFSRTREPLEEIAQSAPARVLVVQGDVTQAADLEELVNATTRRFGGVDVLIPNAGVAKFVPFSECTEDIVDEQFRVNFMGAFQTTRTFLPHLNEGAAVLFVTGFPSQVGVAGLGVFGASKAALEALSRCLSVELRQKRIRVNCISPGPVETPLWKKISPNSQVLKTLTSKFKNRLIPGRFHQPEEIAEVALFLASDTACNIYGQVVSVDGGYTAG